MKIDDLRKSSNIEDRRGQSSSSFGGGSSMGSNMLLSLLLSRGGWKTKIVVLLLMFALGGGGFSGILNNSTASNPYQAANITTSSGVDVSDEDAEFVSKVVASTEDYWTQEFKKEGLTYQAPTLVLYTDSTPTSFGTANASSGPFYYSGDRKIYLDLSFYQELSTKYGAAGDFAMAYVIAHEVGHHVQNELGTLSAYHKKHQTLSEKEANALNVRLELQADYYAGAWANYVQGQGLLEEGDFEEAMAAAYAVGDDHLQEQAYGKSYPDSFTHGTSEQRKRWFNQGFKYGDMNHGDTFNANPL